MQWGAGYSKEGEGAARSALGAGEQWGHSVRGTGEICVWGGCTGGAWEAVRTHQGGGAAGAPGRVSRGTGGSEGQGRRSWGVLAPGGNPRAAGKEGVGAPAPLRAPRPLPGPGSGQGGSCSHPQPGPGHPLHCPPYPFTPHSPRQGPPQKTFETMGSPHQHGQVPRSGCPFPAPWGSGNTRGCWGWGCPPIPVLVKAPAQAPQPCPVSRPEQHQALPAAAEQMAQMSPDPRPPSPLTRLLPQQP